MGMFTLLFVFQFMLHINIIVGLGIKGMLFQLLNFFFLGGGSIFNLSFNYFVSLSVLRYEPNPKKKKIEVL